MAKAGPATASINAKTNATVTINTMRFIISATSFSRAILVRSAASHNAPKLTSMRY